MANGKKAAKKATKNAPPELPAAMAAEPLRQDQQPVQQIPLPGLMPVQAPFFSVSGAMILATGNDFLLLLHRVMPLQGIDGSSAAGVAMNQTVAVLTMSPQTAKDISLLLNESVAKFEAEHKTKIETPLTKSKQQAESAGSKKGR